MCLLRGIILLLAVQYIVSHYNHDNYGLNLYRDYYTFYARCGNLQCKQAVQQAAKEKERCIKKHWLGICKPNINWLDRRFPNAMETQAELLQDLCNSEESRPRVVVRCGHTLLAGRLFVVTVNREETCCATARRMTHFTRPVRYGNNSEYRAWPVYCPLTQRYQWGDSVRCINTGCKTECSVSHTYRQYLVTNVRPHHRYGHCYVFWIPVWTMRVKVPTHCTCLVYHDQY